MPKQDNAQTMPSRQPSTLPGHPEVGDGVVQADEQERAALAQMKGQPHVAINEGGRTNDSSHRHNPEGAVHGLPQPALKETGR